MSVVAQQPEKGDPHVPIATGQGFAPVDSGFQNQQYAMQPPMGGAPGGQAVMYNLPPSLQYLASIDEIVINQIFDALEFVTGCERNNRYSICNSQEQQIFFAKEDTDFCTRQCLANMRPFDMQITDNNQQAVIHLFRPFRCMASCMWCCGCYQEMDIESPPGMKIGCIKQLWSCWIPKYEIYDVQGTPLFRLEGICCYGCCTDIPFKVFDVQSGNEIALIVKKWNGLAEFCAKINRFRIQFPREMDLMKKVLLFGATFLIDMVYFERQNNN